jgi:hypothetical protein
LGYPAPAVFDKIERDGVEFPALEAMGGADLDLRAGARISQHGVGDIFLHPVGRDDSRSVFAVDRYVVFGDRPGEQRTYDPPSAPAARVVANSDVLIAEPVHVNEDDAGLVGAFGAEHSVVGDEVGQLVDRGAEASLAGQRDATADGASRAGHPEEREAVGAQPGLYGGVPRLF